MQPFYARPALAATREFLDSTGKVTEGGSGRSSKLQLPNSKKIPSLRLQTPKPVVRAGSWNLELGIFLELGFWDLGFLWSLPSRSLHSEQRRTGLPDYAAA